MLDFSTSSAEIYEIYLIFSTNIESNIWYSQIFKLKKSYLLMLMIFNNIKHPTQNCIIQRSEIQCIQNCR